MIKTLPGTQLFIDQQTKQAFNVDTILLSAFADIPYKTKTVVDIGTGIGSIMLYLSLKTKANLIGIEIQPSRVQEALKNIELNQLSDRISVVLSDVKDVKLKDVDCIICNPPFFKVDETSNVNVSDIDRIARHEISLNLEDLAYHASRMLKFGGKLILIHRPDRFAEIVDIKIKGFIPKN